jgi:nitrogen fixation/metabolism regulation signal transduction histidine kinase
MDPQQITQVLHNLIKNSLEALKEGVGSGISGSQTQDQFLIDSETIVDGQKRPMIEIRTKPSSVGVAVSVHDNGPGIPKELFPRILEPYFTSKDHGTGLGLNIVSRIVEDHGGQLIVATRPVVEGTTMTVFLPTAEGYSRSLEGASMGQEDRNGDEGKFLL